MGQPKTTIELNGKLYDASTGAMVQAPATTITPAVPTNGPSLDGFFRPAHNTTPKKTTRRQAAQPKPLPRKPQHAQTLMRHVVKKPAAQPATTAKAPKTSQPSLPTNHINDRQKRASRVAKSSSISRFGRAAKTTPTVDTKVAHLPVQQHPNTPSASEPPIHKAAKQTATASAGEVSFQKALETAQSHQQSRPKAPRLHQRTAKKLGVSSRALSIASVSLVIILLSGFVAYQSATNISMYIAGNRAGFQGSLPSYTPSGFGLAGPIKATPGSITVSFRSHTDQRTYTVTQQPSNWTSDSLRFNLFKPNDSPVALLDKGKTIYFYNGGSDAAWVNGGVLYQVTGNASLSSDQVVSIADSL